VLDAAQGIIAGATIPGALFFAKNLLRISKFAFKNLMK